MDLKDFSMNFFVCPLLNILYFPLTQQLVGQEPGWVCAAVRDWGGGGAADAPAPHPLGLRPDQRQPRHSTQGLGQVTHTYIMQQN